jgi:hypothetical protein
MRHTQYEYYKEAVGMPAKPNSLASLRMLSDAVAGGTNVVGKDTQKQILQTLMAAQSKRNVKKRAARLARKRNRRK